MAGASNSEDALAAALTDARVIAITIALAALFLSLYVAWRSSKEDEEFEPTHALGVWLGRLGGTSFEFAALSDADFSGATLSNCDFSGATVTRTGFKDAKQLKRARLKNTILNDKAIRELLVTGQGKGQNYWGKNLQGANLVGAKLCKADFTEADLSGAVLRDADFTGAKLIRTQALGANLARADLCEADFTEADLSDADLHGANLKNADLTRSRFIGCNLRDAIVENVIVTDIDIQRLQGLPKPPEKLRLDNGGEMVVLQGEEAKSFFLRREEVKVVLDRALPDKLLAAYYWFIGESKAKNEWPRDIAFIGAYVDHGQTILSYQAPNVEDVVVNLPLLLQPFASIDAVDWSKTLETYSKGQAEPLVGALMVKKEFRSLIADELRKYEEFASTKPVEVRTNKQTIRLETSPDFAANIQPGVTLALQVTLVEGGQRVTEQHFHSGNFQGCSFGDNNSLTNYFGVVDKLGTVEEDVKQKLQEARNAIENSDLPDADKADAVDELNKLTAELGKAEKDDGRVKRYWNRIKEVAPTVASILASAASMAKLLGG
jgi:uncharacterized protein YjbI with pentapeptide repeats